MCTPLSLTLHHSQFQRSRGGLEASDRPSHVAKAFKAPTNALLQSGFLPASPDKPTMTRPLIKEAGGVGTSRKGSSSSTSALLGRDGLLQPFLGLQGQGQGPIDPR